MSNHRITLSDQAGRGERSPSRRYGRLSGPRRCRQWEFRSAWSARWAAMAARLGGGALTHASGGPYPRPSLGGWKPFVW